ncbi:MAG: carbohydrate ABC transporter permease [Chloroflexia bacterium]|nr:carbohydrate ABC transporter permease [Chloroflexia bacterium]
MLTFSKGERIFDGVIIIVLALFALTVIIPFWYIIVMSVTPLEVWSKTRTAFFPPLDKITFAGYEQLLTSARLPRSFAVSVGITVVGTALNLLVTTMMAYPLSLPHFRLRGPILIAVLFTLLFSGGLIPTYLLVRDLRLMDTYWALILPGLVSAWNLLVMKAFFEGLPPELRDAARIDGASDWQVFWQIVLPLSKPILATIGLFYAVAHWNEFFNAILYIQSSEKQPLQIVLRELLSSGNMNEFVDINVRSIVPTQSLRAAAVIIAVVPMLMVYPFLQRHFTKGVLLGSIKG